MSASFNCDITVLVYRAECGPRNGSRVSAHDTIYSNKSAGSVRSMQSIEGPNFT
jgi:hypothetical protein